MQICEPSTAPRYRVAALLAFLVATCSIPVFASDDLHFLQSQWAIATYQVDDEGRVEALKRLAERARQASQRSPEDADILIWKGIIISSLAGEKGGLGALGLAKEAKRSLEQSLQISPDALQGSAHTSLGTLYHQVPGWPIGFGSDKKARKHLNQALKINPVGIDSNYFMAQFLFDEGEYAQSKAHLLKALEAAPRPGRELADSGRHEEVSQLLGKVNSKLD